MLALLLSCHSSPSDHNPLNLLIGVSLCFFPARFEESKTHFMQHKYSLIHASIDCGLFKMALIASANI